VEPKKIKIKLQINLLFMKIIRKDKWSYWRKGAPASVFSTAFELRGADLPVFIMHGKNILEKKNWKI
jgi:hypothetical protein